jgi:hypothetical protein
MFDLFRLWCGAIVRTFRSRRGLMLENLALRQQLAVLKRKHPRPKLGPLDKLFWVVALRFWSRWKKAPSGRTPDFPRGRVIARERLGGLHHRYDRAA